MTILGVGFVGLFHWTGCGGNLPESTAMALITFSPTTATVQNNRCSSTLTFTNQTGENLNAQALNLQLVGDNTGTQILQSRNATEVAALLPTLNLAIGSVVSATLDIDVSGLNNDQTMRINVVLTAIPSQGGPVFFTGTLLCQR